MKENNRSQLILKILVSIAAAFYILFLIAEGIPLINNADFADNSVYFLFLFFLIGYLYLWKNMIISGSILIAWHVIQWLLVFFVWIDGALTLIMGLPIGALGIAVLISGIIESRKRISTSLPG